MAGNLLTARQVQDLFDVDASTVYRMAGDGRLPAVRFGRQWRFPADAIESLLVPRVAEHGLEASGSSARSTDGTAARSGPPAALPVELATSVLRAVAPALGVTMVVTDLGGRAITPVINPAPAIAARLDDPAFLAACTAEWSSFAGEQHLAPRLQAGRYGFLCAHSMVRSGASLVAMVLAGGIAPEGSEDPDLFHLDAERRAAVLETLPNTAALLSQLVPSRHAATPERGDA